MRLSEETYPETPLASALTHRPHSRRKPHYPSPSKPPLSRSDGDLVDTPPGTPGEGKEVKSAGEELQLMEALLALMSSAAKAPRSDGPFSAATAKVSLSWPSKVEGEGMQLTTRRGPPRLASHRLKRGWESGASAELEGAPLPCTLLHAAEGGADRRQSVSRVFWKTLKKGRVPSLGHKVWMGKVWA